MEMRLGPFGVMMMNEDEDDVWCRPCLLARYEWKHKLVVQILEWEGIFAFAVSVHREVGPRERGRVKS